MSLCYRKDLQLEVQRRSDQAPLSSGDNCCLQCSVLVCCPLVFLVFLGVPGMHASNVVPVLSVVVAEGAM